MQQGSPSQIYQDPDNVFTARFIGTPPMNILSAADCPASWSAPAGAAFIGFRPEHVSFRPAGDCVRLRGRVLTREMLGSETLYKIRTDYGDIQVKDFSTDETRRLDTDLYIPRNRLCLFDRAENRIR